MVAIAVGAIVVVVVVVSVGLAIVIVSMVVAAIVAPNMMYLYSRTTRRDITRPRAVSIENSTDKESNLLKVIKETFKQPVVIFAGHDCRRTVRDGMTFALVLRVCLVFRVLIVLRMCLMVVHGAERVLIFILALRVFLMRLLIVIVPACASHSGLVKFVCLDVSGCVVI